MGFSDGAMPSSGMGSGQSWGFHPIFFLPEVRPRYMYSKGPFFLFLCAVKLAI